MLYDRVRLKQNARAAMAQANPKTWLVTLVFILLVSVVSGTISALVPNPIGEAVGVLMGSAMESGSFDNLPVEEQLLGMAGALGITALFSMGATVVVAIFSSIMSYGYCRYALEVYRREAYTGVGSIFKGFSRFGAAVGSSVMVGIFSLLWGLLIYGVDVLITVLVLVLTDGSRVGTWAGLIVLFIAAALIHAIVTYRYCLTPYFVMDNGKLPALQAINASVQAMKGNVWKRFVLDLSFLGWELLRWLITIAVAFVGGILTLLIAGNSIGVLTHLDQGGGAYAQVGIALVGLIVAISLTTIVAVLAQMPLELWLVSYRNVSYAGFYQLLMGKAEEAPVAVAAPVTGSLYFNNTQPAAPVVPDEPKPPVIPEPAGVEAAPVQAPAVSEEAPAAPGAAPVEPAPYTPFGSSSDAPPEPPSDTEN